MPSRDNGFTRFQSLFDNPHSTDPFPDLDGTDVDMLSGFTTPTW
jgi:hypothetical protein